MIGRMFAQKFKKLRIQMIDDTHLRLVYGPGYDREENLERLRAREALTGRRTKFRKVLVQFDLSLGAVEKFVRGKPNHEVQAHIFAMLATDVAPVDLPQRRKADRNSSALTCSIGLTRHQDTISLMPKG